MPAKEYIHTAQTRLYQSIFTRKSFRKILFLLVQLSFFVIYGKGSIAREVFKLSAEGRMQRSHALSLVKNRHARRACVYRWRVWNVLLARYKCWRCNKTECSKRCAIFVVYIADLEIRGIDNSIFTEVGIEYQRQCEKVL